MKLVPAIYFYTLSLIGFIILLIGVFAGIHYIIGVTQYGQYPLGYSTAARCLLPTPPDGKQLTSNNTYYTDCLKGIEQERQALKTADLEKALSFTIIGLLVFAIHFYFARKLT